MQWLRSEDYPWDEGLCFEAASNGHLDIIKWAIDNGCEWNEETCNAAASEGHLEILKWAIEHDCPWNSDLLYNALPTNNLEIIQYLLEIGCEADSCDGVSEEVLALLKENGHSCFLCQNNNKIRQYMKNS